MMLSLGAPPSIFDPPSILHTFRTQPLAVLARLLNQLISLLRTNPPLPVSPIRLVAISDTHCLQTSHIPSGDILIHAGDLTNAGTPSELQAQIDWLDALPHKYKIAIAGNHDTYLDPRSRKTLSKDDQNGRINWKGIRYLQHSSTTLSFANGRRLKLHGAPQIPACGGEEFAFQYPRGVDAWTDTLPADVDVLITHTPPKFHSDLPAALGCEHLLREVWRVKPQVHVFGHVHSGRSDFANEWTDGKEVVRWDGQQRCLEAVLLRSQGWLGGLLDPRCWAGVLGLLGYGCLGVLWDWVWRGEDAQTTVMVLASLMYCNTNRLGNRAQVIDL